MPRHLSQNVAERVGGGGGGGGETTKLFSQLQKKVE